MVGGGYSGFVTYESHSFDPAYFLPAGPTSTVTVDTSAGVEVEVDVTVIVEVSASCGCCDSDVSCTVTEISSSTASVHVGGDSALTPNSVVDHTELSSQDIHKHKDSLHQRSTAHSTHKSHGYAHTHNTSTASPPTKKTQHTEEPEELDFSVISMRTSGY